MDTSPAAQTALGATALAAGVATAAAPATAAIDHPEEIAASADVEVVSASQELPDTSEASEKNDAREIIDKTNEIRDAHGLKKLAPNEELSEGSAQWAQAMSSTNSVEHAEGDFSENLHWTSQSISTDEVVEDWMDAPDHRTNILDPEATEIGAGVVRDSNGTHSVQRFM